jgi:light-independent protochlorophyllide reductase subunit B
VGLEVAACGTYLGHLERDFLFHAHTFTDEAFVEDDPEEVAARIEAADPDLVVGTYLEEGVADSLGVPFLQLCPPTVYSPFVEQPLMGYAGSSVLADALDDALGQQEVEAEAIQAAGMPWTEEAREELAGTPLFLRGRARRLAEERARELGSEEVTREIFLRSRR